MGTVSSDISLFEKLRSDIDIGCCCFFGLREKVIYE